MVFDGVLSWNDYQQRRALWSKQRQLIGLDAQFPDDADCMLFPSGAIARCEGIAAAYKLAASTNPNFIRRAQSIGIDSAEGGDDTTLAACDSLGLIELRKLSTPNTAVITAEAINFGRRHNVPAHKWIFDAGGGGKQHADRLRENGYDVRTVGFGEAATPPVAKTRARIGYRVKVAQKETKYVYYNRRSEMYGDLSVLCAEDYDRGFAIPAEYAELTRQMSMIPEIFDPEGRLKIPPKRKKSRDSNEVTLFEILGCSPDELDALVLAVYGMTHDIKRTVVGSMFASRPDDSPGIGYSPEKPSVGGMW
jgi:hypothetical protein